MGSCADEKPGRLVEALSSGWEFKQSDSGDDQWLPVARVPSVVHLDLLDNGKIPDPFLELNELETDWVAEKSWTYRVDFSTPKAPRGCKSVLVFEGLDTYASVYLNNQLILTSENMFLSHTVDVTTVLKHDGTNHLSIDFDSALLRGRKIQSQHPEHDFIAHNGESSRLAVRKAQYHYGWDWGPILMCCGPWKPVRLETYMAKIDDLWSDIKVDSGLASASGKVFARVDGPADHVQFKVAFDGQILVEATAAVGEGGVASVDFHLDNPKLWYPHSYGAQPLYDVSARPLDGTTNTAFDEAVTKRVGFRKVELVRDQDKHGRSFYFRVNGVDVFCGGSCWIPADSFLTRISAARYRGWLQMTVDAGHIMTRVWGGGIYEDDAFYDICDELGILVWQDFMFACASYPTFPSILESIRAEARCNVQRLRHHASIIIYAGNNEDYQVQELHKLKVDYDDKDPESWLKSEFPARYIFEHLLPGVMAEEAPNVLYWPSSPFSGEGKLSSDPTTGDVHEWDVWHGKQEKYQLYETIGGRFVSEFGVESLPNIETVKYFAPNPADQHSHSRVLDFHNKFDGQERRLAGYFSENFRPVGDLESYIHTTQIAQADAMSYAYSGWRKQWGQDRRCGGALVWQLNDCWPCASWAVVDYFLRKKPAYYAIGRALAPVAVGVRREIHDWCVPHDRGANKALSYDLWVVSGRTEEVLADVELRFVSIATGKDIKERRFKEGVRVAPCSTTPVFEGVVEAGLEPHVLASKLWVDGVCVSRDVDWPQPLKYLSFEDRGIQVTSRAENSEIVISAEKPVKAFVFEERDGVKLSDSALSIIPGDEQVIKITGMNAGDKPLGWRYLGQTN
ncbi:uncharacterized protein E0L32_010406 [Thyridium curvatum]|uniref:Beta-mannosidase B n=1 Tax=Thyridium curvatum TaxID=1093900 RepID=A0A507ASR5_9PEZI|nr:uncharacterized protein E0L32_010406 [Thyridium curvatum]TPX07951.1 hypothetical protein E0L32_010406 [Thyridium curvatum]